LSKNLVSNFEKFFGTDNLAIFFAKSKLIAELSAFLAPFTTVMILSFSS
jgi:hypothetical protein